MELSVLIWVVGVIVYIVIGFVVTMAALYTWNEGEQSILALFLFPLNTLFNKMGSHNCFHCPAKAVEELDEWPVTLFYFVFNVAFWPLRFLWIAPVLSIALVVLIIMLAVKFMVHIYDFVADGVRRRQRVKEEEARRREAEAKRKADPGPRPDDTLEQLVDKYENLAKRIEVDQAVLEQLREVISDKRKIADRVIAEKDISVSTVPTE